MLWLECVTTESCGVPCRSTPPPPRSPPFYLHAWVGPLLPTKGLDLLLFINIPVSLSFWWSSHFERSQNVSEESKQVSPEAFTHRKSSKKPLPFSGEGSLLPQFHSLFEIIVVALWTEQSTWIILCKGTWWEVQCVLYWVIYSHNDIK